MAETIVEFVIWYSWFGGIVAAAFLIWGIDRVDPSARGAYLFRPLLIPGILCLWPLVLWRWGQLEGSGAGHEGEP